MAPVSSSPHVHLPDVLIVGAGIIGLSLALELQRRGASVMVLERDDAWGAASRAAAGMLAAEDPHNPPPLLPLSRYSLSLYSNFLARIEALSGQAVPYQTSITVQHTSSGTYTLAEDSLDPRQLGPALLAAARAASITVIERASVVAVDRKKEAIAIRTAGGDHLTAANLVHTTGAWNLLQPTLPLAPRKGQMLRVAMPPGNSLQQVHRAGHIYVVPRVAGPQAGTALIGATVEDVGFNLSTGAAQLQHLRTDAAALSPATAFAAKAPLVEAWAGLRPYTPDLLPLLGRLGSPSSREWIAAGHFRNGILLAPGTAAALAELLADNAPAVDLSPFAPERFR